MTEKKEVKDEWGKHSAEKQQRTTQMREAELEMETKQSTRGADLYKILKQEKQNVRGGHNHKPLHPSSMCTGSAEALAGSTESWPQGKVYGASDPAACRDGAEEEEEEVVVEEAALHLITNAAINSNCHGRTFTSEQLQIPAT